MIVGIGTDIIEIERIKKEMSKADFCRRFFSDEENEYFKQRGFAPQTVAGNFCAKEAFVKAMGTGFRGFAIKDIEVLRDKNGKPYIKCSRIFGYKIHVSISHSREYAVSQVVIERDDVTAL